MNAALECVILDTGEINVSWEGDARQVQGSRMRESRCCRRCWEW